MVTKGLNTSVEMKDSDVALIGKVPRHWNLTKIKYEVEVFGRIGFRGYTTEDIVDEGEGVITISPSNINNDVFNLDNRTYLSWEKYHESPEIQIYKDDIILVKTGSTIGKTSIIPDGFPEMTINPQLIVLAGFLKKVPKKITDVFKNKIINIHPALLPKYGGKGMYGLYVHQKVIENKDDYSGFTIHYVNENYDEGDIIFQKKIKIGGSNAEDLAKEILKLEHDYYPKIIFNLLNG